MGRGEALPFGVGEGEKMEGGGHWGLGFRRRGTCIGCREFGI